MNIIQLLVIAYIQFFVHKVSNNNNQQPMLYCVSHLCLKKIVKFHRLHSMIQLAQTTKGRKGSLGRSLDLIWYFSKSYFQCDHWSDPAQFHTGIHLLETTKIFSPLAPGGTLIRCQKGQHGHMLQKQPDKPNQAALNTEQIIYGNYIAQ